MKYRIALLHHLREGRQMVLVSYQEIQLFGICALKHHFEIMGQSITCHVV